MSSSSVTGAFTDDRLCLVYPHQQSRLHHAPIISHQSVWPVTHLPSHSLKLGGGRVPRLCEQKTNLSSGLLILRRGGRHVDMMTTHTASKCSDLCQLKEKVTAKSLFAKSCTRKKNVKNKIIVSQILTREAFGEHRLTPKTTICVFM